MKKVLSLVASVFSLVLLMTNVQAQPKTSALPLNMVIGVPEMIIIGLFSCMAITVLIVIIKKVTHK